MPNLKNGIPIITSYLITVINLKPEDYDYINDLYTIIIHGNCSSEEVQKAEKELEKILKKVYIEKFDNGGKLIVYSPATQPEIDFAREKASQGNRVIVRGTTAKGPDYIFNDEFWEFKNVTSGKEDKTNTIRNSIDLAINDNKSKNIFIDGRKVQLDSNQAENALKAEINKGTINETNKIEIYSKDKIIEYKLGSINYKYY